MARKSAKKSCKKSEGITSVGIKMSDVKDISENCEINNNVKEEHVRGAEVIVTEQNVQCEVEDKDVQIHDDADDSKSSYLGDKGEKAVKGNEDLREDIKEMGALKKAAHKEGAVKDEALVMEFDQKAKEFHPRQQPPPRSATYQAVAIREPGEPAEGGQVVGLLQELRHFCTEANTDVVLCCGEGQVVQKFPAHSAMLRARSSVLASLLAAAREASPQSPLLELHLEGVSEAGLEAALHYIYTGWVKGQGLGELVRVGVRLQLPGLLDTLGQLLASAGLREVMEVLVVAQTMGLEQLVEGAVARLTRDRVALVREPWWRDKMLASPGALLRLYEELCQEEVEGVLCYSCGAVSSGPDCGWCSYRGC